MNESVFAWGCKDLHKQEGLEILEQNILSGEYLHSSYDYLGQFEHIKNVSNKFDKKINLISKIYLDIPYYNMIAVGVTKTNNNGLNRYGTLLYQTERIFNFFENMIENFVLQICSVPKNINFDEEEIYNFLKIVNSKFNVNKIFIETFPDAEISTKKLMILIQEQSKKLNLQKELKFGFAGYENLNFYGFSNEIKIFIEKKNFMIMPMKIFSGKSKIKTNKFIKDSLKYIQEISFYNNFFKAVTSTSNLYNHKFLRNESDEIIKTPLYKKKPNILFSYTDEKKINTTPYKINYDKTDIITTIRRFFTLIKAISINPKFLKSLKKTGFTK